jgi:transposase
MSLSERGRFSSKRKREAVLRLLRGEDLDLLSRELGVTGAALAGWRDAFLEGGLSALRTRARDEHDATATIEQLQRKLGEVTMANELLEAKIEVLEAGRPLAGRRSRS